MSAAHTPGPWAILTNGVCVSGPDPQNREVGISGVAHCGMARRTEAENRANAQLVMAAPRLLEVCEKARALIAVDRDSFASCSAYHGLTPGDDPSNFTQIGNQLFELNDAAVVAEYDIALQALDEAIALAIGAPA